MRDMDQSRSAKVARGDRPKRRLADPSRGRPPLSGAVLQIELDRGGGARPFFQQIRAHVRDAVAAGSLSPGVRLPPERQLASVLNISRSTVMRAYQELVADGLVEAAPSRGTVVTRPEQAIGPGAGDLGPAPGGNWVTALPPLSSLGSEAGLLRGIFGFAGRDGVISFASAAPPHDLVPMEQIASCARQAFEEQGAALLSYGPVDGTPELREILAERMRAIGIMTAGDSVIVLSGSTQGLALAARVLVEPGDEVVVEEPAYIGTIQSFGLAGARLIGVPVDGDGLRTDSLEGVLSRRRVRLMVLQPNFHNPTGASLSASRREHVLWLARRYGVPILEDDAFGSLYHNPPPPQSLKQLDRHGLVIYLSSFSKTLAPGLRIAWMCAPEAVVGRVALAKQFSDLNTSALGQAIVSRMISTGSYDANLDRLRAAIRVRMGMLLHELDAMADVFDRDLNPRGGLHVWCRLRVGDAQIAAASAARSGVAVVGGTAFYPPGAQGAAGRDRIRLTLPVTGKDSIRSGTRRLHEALRQLPARAEQGPARRLAVVV